MIQETKDKFKQYGNLIGIVVVVMACVGIGVFFAGNDKKTPQGKKDSAFKTVEKNFQITSKSTAPDKSVWLAKSEAKLESVEQENQRLTRVLEETLKRVEEVEKKKTSSQSTFTKESAGTKIDPNAAQGNLGAFGPPNPGGLSQADKTLPSGGAVDPKAPAIVTSAVASPAPKIVMLSLTDEAAENKTKDAAKTEPTRNIKHFVPSGSFAKVVLLSGVDAPTGGLAQSNPMPILLRVVGRGILPNYTDSQIRNCHITGAAMGDISSERALIRIERLSCVLKSGDVIEVQVKGYVAGEDGKNGLRGRLVSKQGSMIAKSAMAGVFSGIGTSIADQYKQIQKTALGDISTVDPKRAGEAGMATGASTSLDKISDYYLARANETYPIIEIDANRIGEVVITEGFDLKTEITGKIQETRP